MEAFRRELKRGTMELILLKILEKEDMYGYQIVSTLEELGGEFFKVKEGTLYPILYRLEDSGFIKSRRYNPETRGVPRKYYRLTNMGIEKLSFLAMEWRQYAKVVSSLLDVEGKKDE